MDPAPLLPAWLDPFLPGREAVLLGVPFALAWAAPCAALAGWLRTRRGIRTAYTRKLFHFLIISAAGVAQLAWGLGGVTVFGSVVSLLVVGAVLRGDGFAFYEALARPGDEPHRTLFILVPLATTALGGVLANVFFAPFAPVAYMVTGWGDGVGEPVGTRWGRRRYRVPSLAGVKVTRSVEGSAAVLLTGAAAAALVLLGMGVPWRAALAVGAACGTAGAAVEAVSSHGLDNLTVQLAAGGMAWLLLG